MARRLIVLTEGYSNPINAKTAVSVIRYRPGDVVAVLDSAFAGKTASDLLGIGGDIPVVGSIEQAPVADTLLVGIAPQGGKLPAGMRQAVLAAIQRGMTIESGLHEFLADDPEFAAAAAEHGSQLIDVRRNRERDVAKREGIDERCLRIHAVGNDCCVGKMVVSIEVADALKAKGHDAVFVATGQTGIMIAGSGCPIDCVVSDFINGASEKLVLAHQQHEIMVIEGQGSLAHPAYSAVTLGLLHGCMPDGLIVCYEVGRTHVNGLEHVPLKSLEEIIRANEAMANLMHPCRVIGVAMNSRLCTPQQAEIEREQVRARLSLPVCDVYRHGADELADAVLRLQREIGKGV
ncbi:MAG: DUF1611 domain-containing protein [Pirellulales bacterium]|nr:DUF1611 domain-containing protein [Pirellulales bacterium]